MRYLLKDDHKELRPRGDILHTFDHRFERCVGAPAWAALPAAVKARFGHKVGMRESCVYQGHILQTRMNMAGRILAQILRIVGAPLPLDCNNKNAAAVVSITDNARENGQFWTRQYGRSKGFPQVLHSTKRFAGPTGLEEYIGAGIGMTLLLSVEDGVLWFNSDRYYIGGKRLRAYLPRLLCPGQLRVGHEDIGRGSFLFTLELKHKLFGELISQTIKFNDPEARL